MLIYLNNAEPESAHSFWLFFPRTGPLAQYLEKLKQINPTGQIMSIKVYLKSQLAFHS